MACYHSLEACSAFFINIRAAQVRPVVTTTNQLTFVGVYEGEGDDSLDGVDIRAVQLDEVTACMG